MKKLITNLWLISSCSLAWVLFSLCVSIILRDWQWFERSGSILTLAGAALVTRPLLRLGIKELFESEHIIDGGGAAPTPEEIERERQEFIDTKASHIGFWFIFMGTLVWGYGQIVGSRIFSYTSYLYQRF